MGKDGFSQAAAPKAKGGPSQTTIRRRSCTPHVVVAGGKTMQAKMGANLGVTEQSWNQ